MRDISTKLTSSKNLEKKNNKRAKSFGYQVLGFGSGVAAAGPYIADFVIVAGGGGGGGCGTHGNGSGAGGGGMIFSYSNPCAAGLEFNPGTPYAVTVGAGGTNANNKCMTRGSSSSVVHDGGTRTATGGGAGLHASSPATPGQQPGGAGGGGPGGVGNTPAVPAADGGPQGASGSTGAVGGGGGGGKCGAQAPTQSPQGIGGAGTVTAISGSPEQFAGGGGGGAHVAPGGAGGAGGGASGGLPSTPNCAAANTGGGGGGFAYPSWPYPAGKGGSGGSGKVYLRFPGDANISATPGTNSISTLPALAGGCKLATFTVTGAVVLA